MPRCVTWWCTDRRTEQVTTGTLTSATGSNKAVCDTRAVVLKDESLSPTTENAYCTIESGRWLSYYNGQTYTDPSQLQIDHVVPVANAWVSGAWHWSQARRVAFYNDLGDSQSLVAVDAHDNESKSDQTPDEWLPPEGDCRYGRDYRSVKLRWGLSVTRHEKKALVSLAGGCPNRLVSYDNVRAGALGSGRVQWSDPDPFAGPKTTPSDRTRLGGGVDIQAMAYAT